MIKVIEMTGEEHKHLQDKRVIWELIKLNIRSFTIPYSIQKAKENNKLEANLNKRYLQLHNVVMSDTANEKDTEEFHTVKQELESLQRHKARGAILRSKCRWVEEGEKNSSYFLRLEKRNYCNKVISNST